MLLDSFDGASRRLVMPADACGARERDLQFDCLCLIVALAATL